MDINQIDWSQIWKEGIIFFAGKADKASSWDQGAYRWNKEDARDYAKKVLERIKIKPNYTVLDVGCGPGLLAIPMAKKCKHLTGLDISSQMLKYLKENADQKNVTNIEYINHAFETAEISKDVKQHDIVVASRSMGWEYNLEKFLGNLDNAAKKRVYVIWGASDRNFDIDLYKAIGRPYRETRTYIIIYNLLYQMGIRANIEIFQTKTNSMKYKTVDEAMSEQIKRFERRGNNEELNSAEKYRLQKYLKETLMKTEDGTFRRDDSKAMKHALIWWKKE